MEKTAPQSVSSGISTVIPSASLSTESQTSSSASVSMDAKAAPVFTSKERNAGVQAVLEKRKEEKGKEKQRMEKLMAELVELDLEIQTACDKNIARLAAKNKKKVSASCPSSQNVSRTPSNERNHSPPNISRNFQFGSNKSIGSRASACSGRIEPRLVRVERKLDAVMRKLGEMSLRPGSDSPRPPLPHEASLHGCVEIQYVYKEAVDDLEKAAETLQRLELLPTVYAKSVARNSLRDRYEMQNLLGYLNDFIGKMKNLVTSYDTVILDEMDDCIACSSQSKQY